MKAVRSARWVSIHLFVPRLVNALASWSQAVSIAEAMAKHIEENLGYTKKHQELLKASRVESFFGVLKSVCTSPEGFLHSLFHS